ncbi:MAG: DUF1289 domain-containing protein [Betaproteobacteria bacterium]
MTIRTLTVGGPAPSPCNSVCTMDEATGFCAGCFRTLDEIAAWGLLDDADKREVWAALAQRRLAAQPVGTSDTFHNSADAKR